MPFVHNLATGIIYFAKYAIVSIFLPKKTLCYATMRCHCMTICLSKFGSENDIDLRPVCFALSSLPIVIGFTTATESHSAWKNDNCPSTSGSYSLQSQRRSMKDEKLCQQLLPKCYTLCKYFATTFWWYSLVGTMWSS